MKALLFLSLSCLYFEIVCVQQGENFNASLRVRILKAVKITILLSSIREISVSLRQTQFSSLKSSEINKYMKIKKLYTHKSNAKNSNKLVTCILQSFSIGEFSLQDFQSSQKYMRRSFLRHAFQTSHVVVVFAKSNIELWPVGERTSRAAFKSRDRRSPNCTAAHTSVFQYHASDFPYIFVSSHAVLLYIYRPIRSSFFLLAV